MKLTTERIFFYLFCVLSASPLLFSHYPPMIDLPQHAAQISTFNRLDSPNFLYADLYQLIWTTPYLGGYTLLWLLSQCLPILTATKILIGAVIIAIPLTTARLRAYFHGDPAWDWLMLPIGYGFVFQWGLFNFLVGVPIVLTFLLYVFRYAENPKVSTGCWLALFGLLLYAAHLLIALFGCGLAFLYIVSGQLTKRKKLLALLPFIAPPLMGAVWAFFNITAGGQAAEAGPWRLSIYRPVEFLASAIGAFPLSPANMAIGAFTFSLPFLLGARFTTHKPRLLILGALLIWTLLGPDYLFGNYFNYNRFAIFGLPLFILALTPSTKTQPHAKILRSLFYILPVTLILAICLRFATFDQESRGYRDIAVAMKPGKRVMTLMFNNQSVSFGHPTFLHFPTWYQAESTGIVDFSFSQFRVLVAYKPDAGIPVPRGFEWFPKSFNWTKHQGWQYDYFVVRHEQDLGPLLFPETDCPVKLIAHSEWWWLYETQIGGASQPNACDIKRQEYQRQRNSAL